MYQRFLKLGIGIVGLVGIAQAAWAFSVKPGGQVITVKEGQTAHVEYEISNDKDTAVSYTCQLRDSYVLPENKGISVGMWLTPEFTTLSVPAHGTEKAPFKVSMPKGAQGELDAQISFTLHEPGKKQAEEKIIAGMRTVLVSVITVSLFARVQGTEKGMAQLGTFEVNNRPGTDNQPARVQSSIIVKNMGNVHQRPSVHVEVFHKEEEGNPLFQMDYPGGWPVMPHSEFPYKAETTGTLAPGDYMANAVVTFQPGVTTSEKTAFSIDLNGNTTNYKELP